MQLLMMNRFAMLSLFIAVCSCVYQAHAFSTSFSHDSKSRALNPVLVPPVIAARTRNGLSFSSLSLFRNRIRRKQQQASCHSDNDSNSGDDLIPDKTTERTLLSKKLRNLVPTRKKLKRLVFTMTIFLFSSPALARSSGGRIGGSSFRSRPSMSRPIRHSYRPPRRSLGQPIYRAPPTRLHYRPPIYRPRIYNRPTVVLRGEDYALQQTAEGPYASIRSRPRKRISVSDLVLVTGTGVAITYKVMDHYYKKDYNDENESPLGPGMSVASLTVAMQVPDRTDSNSILVDLERRAQTAQTNTQRGLQTLVSEIALELLRKESSIFSVESSVTHHRSMTEAERTFQRLSVRQRGKLDRESANNYDGAQNFQRKQKEPNKYSPLATIAVVTLSFCIEGNSLLDSSNKIRSRSSLIKALTQIAADALVNDSLLSAELLWTPEDPSDTLSVADVHADYPTLLPLMD